MKTDWSSMLALVLTGLVVVFVALILLVVVFYFFGKTAHRFTKQAEERRKQASAAIDTKTVPQQTAQAPKPQVVEFAGDGLSDEIVAAITGAISAILSEEGDGKAYVVKSIKRVRQNRHAWGKAGIAENTRPF